MFAKISKYLVVLLVVLESTWGDDLVVSTVKRMHSSRILMQTAQNINILLKMQDICAVFWFDFFLAIYNRNNATSLYNVCQVCYLPLVFLCSIGLISDIRKSSHFSDSRNYNWYQTFLFVFWYQKFVRCEFLISDKNFLISEIIRNVWYQRITFWYQIMVTMSWYKKLMNFLKSDIRIVWYQKIYFWYQKLFSDVRNSDFLNSQNF